MVQLDRRGQMLLPRDVSHHLEHQGTQSIDPLRRDLSRPRALSAALRYIAERELKRQTNEWLALLNDGEQILVMVINEAECYRLKRLAIGESLTLSSTGQLITMGRQRK
jgi:hypothetical protein